MENNNNSNKRIVKNTLLLYIRMFVILILNLYTSRVILDALGVVDYGIYNVVGSVVVMFSYMNSALSLATTRFFSYEMHNGITRLKTVFNTSVVIQFAFSLAIVFIAETIGLWLVNNKLVIPIERLIAANWVYQFSIFTTVLSIISVSYTSAITSHERMGIYAVLSIIEVVLKLIIALLIVASPLDKLIFYGSGLLLVTFLSFILKLIYCKRNFEEIVHARMFSKELFKKMFSFVGWNFFGATAGMSVGQGLNFVINIFFGPAVNAARGIAFQIEGAVNNFVTSINTAVNPQIVKRYSVGDYKGMMSLVFFSSKISFILLLLISLPIIIDADYILGLWLKEVPEHTVLFTRLTLVYIITLSVTYAINMSAQATGKIRLFQMTEGIIVLLNIPISLILFEMGMEAYVSFVIMIVLSITAFSAKLFVLTRIMEFPIRRYLQKVVSRIIIVTVLSAIIFIVSQNYPVSTFLFFTVKTCAYFVPVGIIIWFTCFNGHEKNMILNYVQKLIKR